MKPPQQSIIYLPRTTFYRARYPQCYYFSCQNLLIMQNLQDDITDYVKEIVTKCKNVSIDEYDDEKYKTIIMNTIIEYADDLLD